ncbi:hypothetical protein [Streptomyces sp. NPDC056061]
MWHEHMLAAGDLAVAPDDLARIISALGPATANTASPAGDAGLRS